MIYLISLVLDMSRPPLVIKGSLDVSLDSHHVQHIITKLPITVTVGISKLLAPGSFQDDDFTLTCLAGHTKTERVPLKNAGNIPLTVLAKMSMESLFLVSPHSLQIQPGEVHVHVCTQELMYINLTITKSSCVNFFWLYCYMCVIRVHVYYRSRLWM